MAANANRLFHRADPLKRHVEEIERMAAQALPPPDPISAEDVAPELNEEEELDYDFLSSSELAGCATPSPPPCQSPSPSLCHRLVNALSAHIRATIPLLSRPFTANDCAVLALWQFV
jgi:hypothetical protein